MASLLFVLHQFNKTLEVMLGVVWTGSGFGVILNRNDRERLMAQAFDAAVVEVDVGDFDFGRQAVFQYREAVIV